MLKIYQTAPRSCRTPGIFTMWYSPCRDKEFVIESIFIDMVVSLVGLDSHSKVTYSDLA